MGNLSAIKFLGGQSADSEPPDCPNCDATGYCPHCEGRGRCYNDDCPDCPSIRCTHCKGTGFCPECDEFGFWEGAAQ
jgi:hypothetical protein